MFEPSLPLENRRFWLVTFVLSLIAFWVYYGGNGYEKILYLYGEHNVSIDLKLDEDISDKKDVCNDLQVALFIPKALNNSGTQTALIRVVSENSGVISGSVAVYMHQKTDADTDTLPPDVFAGIITGKQSSVERVDVLLYHRTVGYYRIDIPYAGGLIEKSNSNQFNWYVAFNIDSAENGNDNSTANIDSAGNGNDNSTAMCYFKITHEMGNRGLEFNALRSALYLVIERLLFPPWANVFLPLMIASVVWINDKHIYEAVQSVFKEHAKEAKVLREFVAILLLSVVSSLLVGGLLCLLIGFAFAHWCWILGSSIFATGILIYLCYLRKDFSTIPNGNKKEKKIERPSFLKKKRALLPISVVSLLCLLSGLAFAHWHWILGVFVLFAGILICVWCLMEDFRDSLGENEKDKRFKQFLCDLLQAFFVPIDPDQKKDTTADQKKDTADEQIEKLLEILNRNFDKYFASLEKDKEPEDNSDDEPLDEPLAEG